LARPAKTTRAREGTQIFWVRPRLDCTCTQVHTNKHTIVRNECARTIRTCQPRQKNTSISAALPGQRTLNKNESLAHGTPTMRLTMERMKDDATVNGDVGAVRLCAKKSVVSARSLVTKKEDGLEKPGLVEVSQTIKSLDELCPRRTKATKKEWISRYTSLGRVIRRNGSVEIQGLERDQSKYKPWKGSDEKTGLGRAKA